VNGIIEFEPHEVEPNPSLYFFPRALDYHIFKKEFSLGESNVFFNLFDVFIFVEMPLVLIDLTI
jgi:hypothetical protein